MEKLSLFLFILTLAVGEVCPVQAFGKGRYEDGITIADVAGHPPQSFIGADGKPQGMLIDYWKKWSKETGIPVSFKLVEWGETLEMVKNGTCDVHSGLYRTPERDEYLDFARPSFNVPAIILANKASSITSLRSLRGNIISVVHKGGAEEFLISNKIQVELQTDVSAETSVRALLNGEVDAVLGDRLATLYHLAKLGGDRDNYRISEVYDKPIFPAVAKGNKELLDIVNHGISLIDEQELAVIEKSWYVVASEHPYDLELCILIAGGVLLGLCVLAWVCARFVSGSRG